MEWTWAHYFISFSGMALGFAVGWLVGISYHETEEEKE